MPLSKAPAPAVAATAGNAANPTNNTPITATAAAPPIIAVLNSWPDRPEAPPGTLLSESTIEAKRNGVPIALTDFHKAPPPADPPLSLPPTAAPSRPLLCGSNVLGL